MPNPASALIACIDRMLPQLRSVQNAANQHRVAGEIGLLVAVKANLELGRTDLGKARGIIISAFNFLCQEGGKVSCIE